MDVRFEQKRAITLKEHQAIVEREQNPQRKAFYRLAWHLGAAQATVELPSLAEYERQQKTLGMQQGTQLMVKV